MNNLTLPDHPQLLKVDVEPTERRPLRIDVGSRLDSGETLASASCADGGRGVAGAVTVDGTAVEVSVAGLVNGTVSLLIITAMGTLGSVVRCVLVVRCIDPAARMDPVVIAATGAMIFRGEYVAGGIYRKNDVVTVTRSLWVALVDGPVVAPGENPAEWISMGGGSPTPPGDSGIILVSQLPINPLENVIYGLTSDLPLSPPSIAPLINHAALASVGIADIPIAIDSLYDVDELTLSVESSDSSNFPISMFHFGGVGGARTLAVDPGVAGAVIVSVIVREPLSGLTARQTMQLIYGLRLFSLTTSVIGAGTIAPPSGNYVEGQLVEVVVEAAEGFYVAEITADGVPMAGLNTWTVTMDQDRTVSALVAATPAPTISAVADITAIYQSPTSTIAETIGATSLAAISSDQSLIPDGNVIVTGSEADGWVITTTSAIGAGDVTITLTATGTGGTTTASYVITVTPALLIDGGFESGVLRPAGNEHLGWTDREAPSGGGAATTEIVSFPVLYGLKALHLRASAIAAGQAATAWSETIFTNLDAAQLANFRFWYQIAAGTTTTYQQGYCDFYILALALDNTGTSITDTSGAASLYLKEIWGNSNLTADHTHRINVVKNVWTEVKFDLKAFLVAGLLAGKTWGDVAKISIRLHVFAENSAGIVDVFVDNMEG